MEDRKKFTYRYDDETEKLLSAGLEKFNLSSLNKLIDKLIVEALVRYPQGVKEMGEHLIELSESLDKCMAEKKQIEKSLNKLKEALKRDIENKETINKLIQEP